MLARIRRWRRHDDRHDDTAARVARVRARLAAVDREVLDLLLDERVPGRGQRLRALDLAAGDLRRELDGLGGEDPTRGSTGPAGDRRIVGARSAEPECHPGRRVR